MKPFIFSVKLDKHSFSLLMTVIELLLVNLEQLNFLIQSMHQTDSIH